MPPARHKLWIACAVAWGLTAPSLAHAESAASTASSASKRTPSKRATPKPSKVLVRFPTLQITDDGRSLVSVRLSDAEAEIRGEPVPGGYRITVRNARIAVRNDRHVLDAEFFGVLVRSVRLSQRGTDVVCEIGLRAPLDPTGLSAHPPEADERAEEPRKDAGVTAQVWTVEFPRVTSTASP